MKQDTIECLITGCGLLTDQGYAWGDLWGGGQCFVFNAVLNNGEINWDTDPNPGARVVSIESGLDYFERRGVVVIPKMNAKLNGPAKTWLGV